MGTQNKIVVQVGVQKREATADELAQFEKDRIESETQASLIEAEQTKKENDRASAIAKLKKLGLTDDEVSSLIP